MKERAPKKQNIIVLDIDGDYSAESIKAYISAETTARGVRLTFGGPIGDAIVGLQSGTWSLTPASRAALEEG